MGVFSISKWLLSKILPAFVKSGFNTDFIVGKIKTLIPDIGVSAIISKVRSYELETYKALQTVKAEKRILFPKDLMIETDMKTARRYMVKYKFTVLNESTGDITIEYRNLYTQKRGTLEDWESKGMARFKSNFEKYVGKVADMEVYKVYHQSNYTY